MKKSEISDTDQWYVEPPQQTATTKSTAPREEETSPTTSSASAGYITEGDTDNDKFTGEESIEILLELSSEERKEWALYRLGAFRDAIVKYAETCQRVKAEGKTVSESEWQAIIETDGLTRAVPNETEILKWILSEK